MKPTYRGDHWEGINSIEIGFSGGIPEALVSGRMQFRKDKKRGGIADYEINTASSGIIIDDSGSNGTGWALSIPQQALNLSAGTFYWDLETIDSNSIIKTYISGDIVLGQDITR